MLSVSSSTIASTPPDHRVAGGGHAHRENCVHLYPGGRRFGRVPSSPSDGPGFHLAERSSASPSDGQRGCGRGVSLRDHGAVKVAPPSVTNLPAQAGVWARGHGSNAMPGTCNRPHAATTALSAGRSTACSTAAASMPSARAFKCRALVPDGIDASGYSDEQAAGMGFSGDSGGTAHDEAGASREHRGEIEGASRYSQLPPTQTATSACEGTDGRPIVLLAESLGGPLLGSSLARIRYLTDRTIPQSPAVVTTITAVRPLCIKTPVVEGRPNGRCAPCTRRTSWR